MNVEFMMLKLPWGFRMKIFWRWLIILNCDVIGVKLVLEKQSLRGSTYAAPDVSNRKYKYLVRSFSEIRKVDIVIMKKKSLIMTYEIINIFKFKFFYSLVILYFQCFKRLFHAYNHMHLHVYQTRQQKEIKL